MEAGLSWRSLVNILSRIYACLRSTVIHWQTWTFEAWSLNDLYIHIPVYCALAIEIDGSLDQWPFLGQKGTN